jgi:putative chitinase
MTIQKLILKLPLQVVGELDEVIKTYNISNPNRLAHFLAQCGHESGNFKLTVENVNYSEEGLLKVFPKYFDKNTAKSYARRPEMIANMVYGGRMGNGDKNSGDGYKFRGRGFIQLTGKTNYKSFGDYIGVDLITNPSLVATKYALSSAAWFFEKRKLWQVCDEGIELETIKKVTKLVNGGYNGLEDRISKTNIFYKLIT